MDNFKKNKNASTKDLRNSNNSQNKSQFNKEQDPMSKYRGENSEKNSTSTNKSHNKMTSDRSKNEDNHLHGTGKKYNSQGEKNSFTKKSPDLCKHCDCTKDECNCR